MGKNRLRVGWHPQAGKVGRYLSSHGVPRQGRRATPWLENADPVAWRTPQACHLCTHFPARDQLPYRLALQSPL